MISVYLLLDYARHEHCLTGARPTCPPNGWHTGAKGRVLMAGTLGIMYSFLVSIPMCTRAHWD